MRRPLVALSCLLAAGSAAPAAWAQAPTRHTLVDLPSAGSRSLAVVSRAPEFSLVGLQWRGSGEVLFRTRSLDGRWSGWRPAAPEPEDAPDLGSRELRRAAGWTVGNPWWVGPSDRVEVRRVGRVGRVRAHLIASPVERVPFRAPAVAGTPAIVPRSAWGADESIRRNEPAFAPQVRFAVVHHTAGRNAYSREEAPAIVRAIQVFHVKGNGWNDIGYNFLVDRFGTIYEGRYGGITRNVVGAHAQGFNTGSVGIAVLGTYGDAGPSRAAQEAVEKLAAWRLDVAHVDPLGMLTFVSGGNERFPLRSPVVLRAVSGHRDTGSTECPGNGLYGRLRAIASNAAKLGLPKIFEARVDASAEGLVRFRARLSGPLPWTVAVMSAGGGEIARGEGTGTRVDWTWDAAGVPPARYAWSIATPSARPALGAFRAGLGSATLAVEELAATPAAITPNGDGQADVATLGYRLSTAANVTVEVVDEAGNIVSVLVDRVWTRAGAQSLTLDANQLPDGRYTVVVRARTATSVEVVSATPLAVTRTLGLFTLEPGVFSPNGDGRSDRVTLGVTLAAPADVRVRVLREGRWVATPLAASLPAGRHEVAWHGKKRLGRLLDGTYEAVVEATDAVGTASFALALVSDTVAPRVRILPGRRLRISVSEPAVLRIYVNGQPVRREVERAGTILVRWPEPVVRARVVALDAAGNASVPAIRRRGA